MARSMQLGHCICDPKKSCPCDVYREQDLCPCAGERPQTTAGPARLTDLVHRPGCASKIDARSLRRILAGLPSIDDPRVLVGMPAADDAGVYKLDEDQALVQTVDVFSPSVDDPYTFGQIAAANSVSDVYAMGGRPITALSIVGFPVGTVPDEVLREILRGGNRQDESKRRLPSLAATASTTRRSRRDSLLPGLIRSGEDHLECRAPCGRSARADQAARHGRACLCGPDWSCPGGRPGSGCPIDGTA